MQSSPRVPMGTMELWESTILAWTWGISWPTVVSFRETGSWVWALKTVGEASVRPVTRLN